MAKDKRVKVFFDALPLSTDRTSGIGHLIVETIKAFSENPVTGSSYRTILIVPRNKLKSLERWDLKSVEIKTIPVRGKIWSALVLWRLLLPADILFGKGVYVFGNTTTWPLLFSKCITYVHDLNFLENPETVKKRTRDVLKKNLPLWIKRADVVATISEFSKTELVKYFRVDEDKIEVIYCGVDRSIYYPRSSTEIDAVKGKYSIRGGYVLFLSNIEPRKNVDRLLDAYSRIDDSLRAEIALVLVGADGWLNDTIKEKIEVLRDAGMHIIWPEQFVPDEDLPALLSGAKLLAHPALYEGFGISPLQAMSCGTPVLVSNSTSLPEVAGEEGIYVDPTDVTDIVDKLSGALIDKDTKKRRRDGLIAQSKKFSWEAAGYRLKVIIDNLVK